MKYPFKCPSCEKEFIYEKAMEDDFPTSGVLCTSCGAVSDRVWDVAPVMYKADGFHSTDYGKRSHKVDTLVRNYERTTGEKAPPPAVDAPTNYDVGTDPNRHQERLERVKEKAQDKGNV